MLDRINTSPRFLLDVCQGRLLDPAPLVVLDVGASGGFPPCWSAFGDQARLIGFEPDADECRRLREKHGLDIRPVALGRRREARRLNKVKWAFSSSFLDINRDYWSRFPMGDMFESAGEETIETVDLDSYAAESGLADIDYLKLDTEGTELEILEGAAGLLAGTILAVEIEVAFQPLQHGRAMFSDVDAYLRAKGFTLFDLAPMRHARASLPPLESFVAEPSSYGQVVWAEALYVRDLVADLKEGRRHAPLKYVKAAALFELFSLPDCAIEVLESAAQAGAVPESYAAGLNLLVPEALRRRLPLAYWRELFRHLPQLVLAPRKTD
jgi:FkbM family methyltransferase